MKLTVRQSIVQAYQGLRRVTAASSKRIVLLGLVSLMVMLGVHSLNASYAVVPALGAEPEQGALSGSVAILSDTSASADKAVKFEPPVAAPNFLWSTDYDNAALNTDGKLGNWTAVQQPAPERISLVAASQVPGFGTYKPPGNALRVELRPGDSYNSSGIRCPPGLRYTVARRLRSAEPGRKTILTLSGLSAGTVSIFTCLMITFSPQHPLGSY